MARVLLVGGTGYLGSLIGAALLAETDDTVVVSVRTGHDRQSVIAKLRGAIAEPKPTDDCAFERLIVTPLPAAGDEKCFDHLFAANHIDEVINCAGSVHYFDVDRLRESHIDLVRDLITASKRTKIRRFIHISTAFCSGYVDGELREALHPEPASDPTEYTRFKRSAEWLVAESGVPYIILRPSIVIGDSRDGWYSGQPIGVYQLWSSFAKILMDRYRRRLHFVAQRRPLHFLHQDAFTASVLEVRKGSEAGTIAHLVSAPDRLPTGEDFCRLWCEHVARPHEVNIYRELADVPVKEIDFSYRKWLEFTSINTQISSHDWIFERRYLDKLIGNGLAFPDVSVDTFGKCLNRFVSTSDIIKKYHDKFYSNFP